MVTTPEEYNKYYYQITSNNIATTAITIPSSEPIYNVDLDSRTIETPEFLSVEHDHHAEIIFFKCDRYYDYQDLTQTVGVIEYINHNGNSDGFMYRIPFYDVTKLKHEDKIVFPWMIGGPATAEAGPISFSIRFYQYEDLTEEEIQQGKTPQLIYNLATQVAQSKILHGMNVLYEEDNENLIIPDSTVAMIYQEIKNLRDSASIQWVEASELIGT